MATWGTGEYVGRRCRHPEIRLNPSRPRPPKGCIGERNTQGVNTACIVGSAVSTAKSHTEGLSTDISRRLATERTSVLHSALPGRLSGRRFATSTDLTLSPNRPWATCSRISSAIFQIVRWSSSRRATVVCAAAEVGLAVTKNIINPAKVENDSNHNTDPHNLPKFSSQQFASFKPILKWHL